MISNSVADNFSLKEHAIYNCELPQKLTLYHCSASQIIHTLIPVNN